MRGKLTHCSLHSDCCSRMEKEVSMGGRPRVTVEWYCCCQGAHARNHWGDGGHQEGHTLWRPAGGDLERSEVSVMGGKFCGGCVMMLLLLGCPSTPGLMWREAMTLTKVGRGRSESRLNWRMTGKTNLSDSNLAELVFECEALSYGGRR